MDTNGNNIGTYSVGYRPKKIAFDGKNVWVVNTGMTNGTVSKL